MGFYFTAMWDIGQSISYKLLTLLFSEIFRFACQIFTSSGIAFSVLNGKPLVSQLPVLYLFAFFLSFFNVYIFWNLKALTCSQVQTLFSLLGWGGVGGWYVWCNSQVQTRRLFVVLVIKYSTLKLFPFYLLLESKGCGTSLCYSS